MKTIKITGLDDTIPRLHQFQQETMKRVAEATGISYRQLGKPLYTGAYSRAREAMLYQQTFDRLLKQIMEPILKEIAQKVVMDYLQPQIDEEGCGAVMCAIMYGDGPKS